MAADAIVAQPGTLTGSIGVFSGKFSLRGLYDKVGVAKEVLQRGEHAALYSEYVPWSESDRAHVRAQNEAFYREFVSKAAQGRRSTEEKIDAVAQGRVWTGEAALGVGLVDRIGGFDDAVALAKERAHIPAKKEVALVTLPARKGFLETLFERQEEGPLESRLGAEWRSLVRFAQLLSAGRPLARLPFDLQVR
jgi:protease-4